MPRGIFSQSLFVLFDRAPSLDDLAAALPRASRRAPPSGEGWLGGSPSLLVPFRPEVNGQLVVDAFAAPYPDEMGHPDTDPDTFGCWATGGFGPAVFPGNLARAVQQARRFLPDADAIAEGHRGLVRLRITYVLGAGPDAEILPDDHDALAELDFLTEHGRALLELPGALAWFQPSGEVLLDADGVDGSLAEIDATGGPPLDLHTSVRLWNVAGADGWGLMDTVGMEQLFLPDVEALFHFDHHDPNEVAGFLREVSLFLLARGPDTLRDGDTIDGSSSSWTAQHQEESAVAPPRPVLRLVPTNGPRPPA